ncbi:hypothetical protein F444_16004 [Phytophthora nicotianae P1976]|uniref:Uncharacterized protein n=1 Tax=Phytophthora nicotianae P1976 TaxID=1317066 RepID=A0A080ZJY0_PHYNI|nr:hypothetical protein F444_16004 [Phytophthora nicotianae P1976]
MTNLRAPSFAGLVLVALKFTFTVTVSLKWTMGMTSQLQTQMVFVENIQRCTEKLTVAAPTSTAAEKPLFEWPTTGAHLAVASTALVSDTVMVCRVCFADSPWNIATILQDLVLFLNTVRSNSDPFGQFLDDQNVCKAWLQKAITSQDSADEKGSKFSVTASSDQEKRSSLEIRQIQQSIREELRGCTTLTIANRINNRAALGIGD